MKKFQADPENLNESLSQALTYIQSRLKDYRLPTKQESRAVLMAEESLALLMKHSDFSQSDSFFVQVSKLFGNIRIRLTIPGSPFNFAETLASDSAFDDEGMPQTQEAIQNILIRSFEDRLKYSHKQGNNTITVNAVKSPLSRVYMTLWALSLAVILGVLLKYFAPENFYMAVNDIFLVRFNAMYLNALKTAVTPLVFFSVTVCVARLGSFSEAGKMGAQIIFSFLTKTFIAASIGAVVFLMFEPGEEIRIVAENAAVAETSPQVDYIVNIIPSNIILPFLNMDMIQLLVLSFVIGSAMGTLKDSVKILFDFFEAFSDLFMAITKTLLALLPIGAFCSVLSVLISADTGILISLAGFCLSAIFGLILVIGFVCAYVALFGKLNPLTYIKKYLPAMILSLSSSTAGCIPINLEYCAKLGIPKRIYSFSVPLGATVSLDGAAMYVVLASMMLAEIYGVKLNANDVLSVIVSSAIIAISAPGIPGASLICISAVISQIGVPAEALGIVMSVDAILNIIRTPVNIFSATSTALVVSSRLGVLDRNIFDGKEA